MFFLDTYAMYEIIVGNDKYKEYLKGEKLITTELNLMELYYTLLRLGFEQPEAQYYFFQKFIVVFSEQTMMEAMRFRLKYKKSKLSYTDCMGYIIAKKHKAKFLTGDEFFKNVDNVEFVK